MPPFITPPDFKPVFGGLTATAGGVQANGLPLKHGTNYFTTVAGIGDSATLPIATGSGLPFLVVNQGANQMFVYPNVGDRINAIGVNGAQAVSAQQARLFIDVNPGVWCSLTS